MANRKEAIDFIHEMHDCSPWMIFRQIEGSQQGIGFVLGFLVKSDGRVIAGDIAKALNVSTARIAVILNKMEKQGLITRRTSPTDARSTVVEITPDGVARDAEIKEQMIQKIQLLLDKVGEEDIRELICISRKIKNALEEQAGIR